MTQQWRLRLALSAGSLLMATASFAIGPLGVWMLTDGDNKTDVLIHGSSVTSYAQDPASDKQYAIQWDPSNKQFETVGRDKNGIGGVYTIDHTLVGSFGNYTSFDGEHLDGTLDTTGNHTYAADYTTGDVVKYSDGFFNGPSTSIYNAGAHQIWTITYDTALDTLFLGEDSLIVQIDKSGQVISRFQTLGGGPVRSLAYDSLDNTMWYLSYDGTTAYQTNASGDNLSSMTVNLGGNYWGGEIASVSSVPGPAALLPFAIGGLALLRRRRKSA